MTGARYMVDIHCHVLFGLDDGPSTIEESVEMCRIASTDGIRKVVATPHAQNGMYANEPERIMARVSELNAKLREEAIELEVLPGSDVYLSLDLVQAIETRRILTINDAMRFVLVELPFSIVPSGVKDVLFDLKVRGITPIITHPERNLQIQKDPSILYELVRAGCLSQLTALNITQGCERRLRTLVRLLLEHDLVHIIATDAHSTTRRQPNLSRAVAGAKRIVGEERAVAMVTTTPLRVIEGNGPDIPEPKNFERRFFLSRWAR